MITQYWSSNHFHYERIGRQNKKLERNASPNLSEEDFSLKECAASLIFYEIKCAAGRIFGPSPDEYSVLLMQ